MEVNREVVTFSVKERVVRIGIHLASWAASLGAAVAACTGVYFLCINNLEVRADSAVCFWRCVPPRGYLLVVCSLLGLQGRVAVFTSASTNSALPVPLVCKDSHHWGLWQEHRS